MHFAKNADTIELLKLPPVKNYFENTNIMNKLFLIPVSLKIF